MLGTVGLKNLAVDCFVGIYAHELEKQQILYIDLECDYDFSDAAELDNITCALDYDLLASDIRKTLNEKHYNLIECAAEKIAANLLQNFPVIKELRLNIEKKIANDIVSFVRIRRWRDN